MSIRLFIAISLAKTMAFLSSFLGLGKATSAPGKIALWFYPNLIEHFCDQVKKKKILVSATNGKTTTCNMINTVLSGVSDKVVYNAMGANLERGIASSFIEKSTLSGKIDIDYAILEVDEAVMPLVLEKVKPDIVLLANLFRDQLDRYGEIDCLANKWLDKLKQIDWQTKIVINADDPTMMYLGAKINKHEVVYYGLGKVDKQIENMNEHAADSTNCLCCGALLRYSQKYFSHLGNYDCKKCKFKKAKVNYQANNIKDLVEGLKFDIDSGTKIDRVKVSINGLYNVYNVLAAYTVCDLIGVESKLFKKEIEKFRPAFGRMEEFKYNNRKFKIILIKNPTGANVVLSTLNKIKNKKVILALNDNIADGKDVSWIWDVDIEQIGDVDVFYCLGVRKYDMLLRLKYASLNKVVVGDKFLETIEEMSKKLKANETGYILPTYTAMLELRKILENKKLVKTL